MNTQHIALLTLLTFTFARSLLGQSVGPDVVVRDMRLFYANDEFFVKGVCYSPSPIAQDDTQGHVGYCSAHEYFVIGQGNATEQQSPCYYQDYFDGTSYVGGPPNGFLAVWQRDLPLLQSANVNTLRIYHAFPITSTNVANGGYDRSVQAANHIPFLDLAHSYNMKVIFPLFSDEAYVDQLTEEYMQLYIRNIIDEVGYHPALLMLQFGNELQFSANGAAYIDKVSGYLTYAKNYQLTRWGRNVPITTALIDSPNYYDSLSSLPVDVITTNAGYRGFTFTDLWSGNTAEDFSGFYDLSCSAGKPVLIGEMGVHEDTPSFDVSSWFPQLWGNLLSYKTQGAIGGCVFEYQDEGWKGLTDGTMGMVIPQPTGPWAVDAFYLDTVTPKTTGAYNWTSIVNTFALDPFGSAGQATLSSANGQYCPSGSPSTPLGVNNNVPSGSISTTSAPVTSAPTAPPTAAPTKSPTALPTTISVTSVPTTPAKTVSPTTVSQTTVTPSTVLPTTVLPTTASPTTVLLSTSAPATLPLGTTTKPSSAATTVLFTTVVPTSTAAPTNAPTTGKPSAPATTTAMPTRQVTVPQTSTSAPTSASTTNLPVTSRVTLAPTSTSAPTSSSTPTSTSTPMSTSAPTSTRTPTSTSAPTSTSTPASTSTPTATSSPTNSPTTSVTANPTSAMPTSTTTNPTATSTPAVNPTSPATASPTQQATLVPTAIASTAAPTSAPTTPYASSTPTDALPTSTVTMMPTSTAPPQGKNGAARINALSGMFVAIVVVIASCM